MAGLLEGRTSLILGAANRWSLAYAIAEAFAREGSRLVLTCRRERQLHTLEPLTQAAPGSKALLCDVTIDSDIERLSEWIANERGRLDAVVHSVALARKEDLGRPFLETPRSGFLLAHDVSAYSLVCLARAAAPLMPDGGSITTLSYIGATRVVPHYNVMGVAKASLESSVRYLASELGPRNIRVNAISAGPVKTASARALKDFPRMLEEVAGRAPLRRNTSPAEVAGAALFLASDLGRGVTGNILFVDAGFHIMGL